MTRLLLVIIIPLVLVINIFAQSDCCIEIFNSKFFAGNGIIFNAEYSTPNKLPNGSTRYTPSLTETIQAEEILIKRFNEDLKVINWHDLPIENVQKRYNKYNRQYLGFVDSQGDKHIILQLLNFKCKKKAEYMFIDWRTNYIIGFGGYYEKNRIAFDINLSTNRLELR